VCQQKCLTQKALETNELKGYIIPPITGSMISSRKSLLHGLRTQVNSFALF